MFLVSGPHIYRENSNALNRTNMHTVFVTAFEHANHARVKIVKLVCLVPLEFRESINILWLVRDKACGKGKAC